MKAIHRVVAVASLVGFCGVCGADDPAGKAVGEKQAKNPLIMPPAKPGVLGSSKPLEAPALHLKSFRLKYCDPVELRQILSQLLQASPAASGQIASAAMRTGVAPGGAPAFSRGQLHLVVDDRTRTLFVRGTDADLEKIAAFVETLDAEPGKPVAANSSLHVIKLQHIKADEVMQTLAGLQLNGQVVALAKSNLVVVPTSCPAIKEIDEVIETLDVASTAPAKDKPAAATKPETKKGP